jgi:phosphoribosylaminoimidazolecarboxamide formyltransferase / IMP cyclohydrolase
MINTALLSVSDKTGIVDFARALHALNVKLLSTGGTAKLLIQNGLPVTEISQHTGFPEMLDGRVKTLHPKVHGGLLARRDVPEHMAKLAEHGIPPIDMVVINLYPFESTVANPDVTFDDAIENIDIGGPAMLRSSAKNHKDVTVLIDPADYAAVLAEMQAHQNTVAYATNFRLAKKVFTHTARYDGMIANFLTRIADNGDMQQRADYPDTLTLQFTKVQGMRYGENPHQSAAFYRDIHVADGLLANYRQLQGKELSYNNIADADAAWECVRQFHDVAACVIIKHANPCGVAVAADCKAAYDKAFKTDPTSAFGGIIAFNQPVNAQCAEAVSKQFAEVIIAPGYDDAALAVFTTKQNLRILICPPGEGINAMDIKRVGGGLLVQSPDARGMAAAELNCVTRKTPTPAQLDDLLFAWRVAKFVKSNAIVFCKDGMTVGIGAGQMSRVDSARIAIIKAKNAGLTIEGSVAASDAFFPFRDGLEVLANAGAVAVIQPGGSVRDDEVITAANEHAVAMVVTGVRHFRH